MVGSPSLIVGAPGLTVSGHKRAGGLAVWPVDDSGVPGKRTIVTENSSGIPGVSEVGDEFGYSIAASGSTPVVGTPYENGQACGRGEQSQRNGRVLSVSKGVGISQNSSKGSGAAESHDQSGFSVAIDRGWIAASAPWETVGKVQETGAVQLSRHQADR